MPVAIITGGAAGIGRHLCAGFAREGYVVAALDIQPMSSTHPDIHCFPCDLRDEAALLEDGENVLCHGDSSCLVCWREDRKTPSLNKVGKA